jgi:hypothetical protein
VFGALDDPYFAYTAHTPAAADAGNKNIVPPQACQQNLSLLDMQLFIAIDTNFTKILFMHRFLTGSSSVYANLS